MPGTPKSVGQFGVGARELGSNLGPKPPKYWVKRRVGRYQKARRVNHIAFSCLICKTSIPVQIRAAPPKSLRNSRDWCVPASAGDFLLLRKALESAPQF